MREIRPTEAARSRLTKLPSHLGSVFVSQIPLVGLISMVRHSWRPAAVGFDPRLFASSLVAATVCGGSPPTGKQGTSSAKVRRPHQSSGQRSDRFLGTDETPMKHGLIRRIREVNSWNAGAQQVQPMHDSISFSLELSSLIRVPTVFHAWLNECSTRDWVRFTASELGS